jgi:spermidine/putrescine-binding protein
MKLTRTRTILSWSIFILAVGIMVMPLPGKDTSHLLSEAEASDTTLVILTTTDTDYIQPIVDQFVTETETVVRVESVDEISPEIMKANSADLVIVARIQEFVPVMQAKALDTLPLDIMWNVDENFRDPAERWVGLTGCIEDGDFVMSGMALAQSSNSKPLAERFILYLYSRSNQQALVDYTGHYSFLAFGIETPSDMPQLVDLELPPFGAIYDSNHQLSEPSNELAAK